MDILGTVCSVEEFLSDRDIKINILDKAKLEEIYDLSAGRKYVIPEYQREVRWKKENIIQLVGDLKNRSQFLGNIILALKENNVYEIIDGQQRITSLIMLNHYLEVTYGHKLSVIKQVCSFENESFCGFNKLLESNFNISNLLQEEREDIEASDFFHQTKQYLELWNALGEANSLFGGDIINFIQNFKESKLNIIIDRDGNTEKSIQYFLDVNVKGVKLDPEDIFKGFLFSLDLGPKVREKWKNLKKLSFQVNNDKNIDYYPFMTLFHHYFYCELYRNEVLPNFDGLEFRKDFTLKKRFSYTENGFTKTYQAKEHLLRVISNNAYMLNTMDKLIKFSELMRDIVGSTAPNILFDSYFKGRVDNKEKVVIYKLMRKLILDRDYYVPKVLIMKYTLDVLFNNNSTPLDYKKIYAIYIQRYL